MKTLLQGLNKSVSAMTALKIMAALITIWISFIPQSVNAIQENQNWSWTDNSPKVYSSTIVSNADSTSCQGVYQLKDINGENKPQITCVMAGDKVRFGTYYSGNSINSSVSFEFDSKMHQVWGACNNYNGCLYLPGSDTLITKQYLVNSYVRSLVVYKNFTNRLTQAKHEKIKGYDFDATNPDYIFRSTSGYAWPIGGYGASDSGKWLAVEFRQRGIGILNIETFEMKRISTLSPSYGVGSDPTSELAVSNDGKSLSIMGLNSGFSIYENSSNCGDEATDYRMDNVKAIANPCKKADVNYSEIFDGYPRAFNPRFDAQGGELNFFANSYSNTILEVSLRAIGYGGQKLDYLALGDSYTSGEGETDDKYYLPGTNDKFEKCHLSTRSYPYMLAGLYGIKPELMKSVACSGATTKDIVGSDSLYNGQGDRLADKNLNLSKTDRIIAKSQAKYSFMPGRVRQEVFVQDNDSKIITIGIGGNDAGLMGKLTDCASPGTCDWANNLKEKEQTAVEIKNIFDKLVSTYKKIHEDSQNSKIYVIGYPNIVDPDGKCDSITKVLFNKTERDFIVESIKYLNKVVEAAAKSAGVKYLDIQGSYGNQTLCGSASPKAISGVRTGDDMNLVNDSEWFRFIGNESFHPNSIGHNLTADSIHKSINDLLNHEYCANGTNICPDDTVEAPAPSTFWIPSEYHEYPTQQIANFVSDNSDSTDNRKKDLMVESYSLSPNSPVNIEITSDPISLGDFTASSDGSLTASIDLPIGLAEGNHTIHLYGTSYSGELIELYQIINYIKPADKSDKQTLEHSATNGNLKNIQKNEFNSVSIGNKYTGFSNEYSNPEVKGDSIVFGAKEGLKNALTGVDSKKSKPFSIYIVVLLVVLVALSTTSILLIKKRR